MKINSFDRVMSDALIMGYFVIPRFQRPYSWENSHVEDFWNDVVVDAESDYFIWSIVLFNDGGRFGIVDGQQRLTTITMILCALRNAFLAEEFSDLAQGPHNLVERPDISNKNQYVLQTQSSYPFLQQRIQAFPTSQTEEEAAGDEEKLLKAAFEYVSEHISGTVNAIKSNPSLSTEGKKKQIRQAILSIRDKVLKLTVIVIILESEEDAYAIFETLNTRGKDLDVSDLVRTHITKLVPASNRNVDRAKERFNAIIETFEDSEPEISTKAFLHHYWLAKYEYTTEKKLYKAIKKRIRTRDAALEYLDSIENDATLYRVMNDPSVRKWSIEKRELRDSLRALSIFRIRQQVPFVLSVLRAYEDKLIPLKLARRALRAVENFHFAFTAVTSQRSSGGISFMYALHARELGNANSARDRSRVITDLEQKLRNKLPPYQEFEANFRTILCSEKHTKRKALVQYIFRTMTARFMTAVTFEWEGMTLEHLASQSATGAGGFGDKEVAEIGNLILVSQALNDKLRTKSFPEKMKLLRKQPVWLDPFLKDFDEKTSQWTAETIRKRTDTLSHLAYHTVWKI